MTSGVRLLLIVIVGGSTFLLALIVLGLVGLSATYIQIPAATFLATVALWPLLRPTVSKPEERHPFVNWVSYNAALMLVVGLIVYGVNTYLMARGVLETLQQ